MTATDEIRYGAAPSQFVQLWNPEADPRGLVVMIHGGWWRDAYDLHLMDPLSADLAGRGWAVANLEYRRTGSDGGGWPQTVEDVQAAVAEVRRVRPELAGLPAVAIGHSAGGHLALTIGARRTVDAVVALAPITDLPRCVAEHLEEGATQRFIGAEPDEAPDTYRDASPLQALPLGLPLLLIHGDLDDRVPVTHSRAYATKAAALGDSLTYAEEPGVDHFHVIDPRHPTWTLATDWLGARHPES